MTIERESWLCCVLKAKVLQSLWRSGTPLVLVFLAYSRTAEMWRQVFLSPPSRRSWGASVCQKFRQRWSKTNHHTLLARPQVQKQDPEIYNEGRKVTMQTKYVVLIGLIYLAAAVLVLSPNASADAVPITIRITMYQSWRGETSNPRLELRPGCETHTVEAKELGGQGGVISATLSVAGPDILNFTTESFTLDIPEGFQEVWFELHPGVNLLHDGEITLQAATWWAPQPITVTGMTTGCETGITPTPEPVGMYVLRPEELNYPVGIPIATSDGIRFDTVLPNSEPVGVVVTVTIESRVQVYRFIVEDMVTSQLIPLHEVGNIAKVEWSFGAAEYVVYLPLIFGPEPTPTPPPTIDIAQSMTLTFCDPPEGGSNIHDGNTDTVWGPFPANQEVQCELQVQNGPVKLVAADIENAGGDEWWLKIDGSWLPVMPVQDGEVVFSFNPKLMNKVKFLCRKGSCAAGEVHVWVQP